MKSYLLSLILIVSTIYSLTAFANGVPLQNAGTETSAEGGGTNVGGGGGEVGADFYGIAKRMVEAVDRLCDTTSPFSKNIYKYKYHDETAAPYLNEFIRVVKRRHPCHLIQHQWGKPISPYRQALERLSIGTDVPSASHQAVNNRKDRIDTVAKDWLKTPVNWASLEKRLVFVAHEVLSIMNLEPSETYAASTDFIAWLKNSCVNLAEIYGSQPVNAGASPLTSSSMKLTVRLGDDSDTERFQRKNAVAMDEWRVINPEAYGTDIPYDTTTWLRYQTLVHSFDGACERARLTAEAEARRACIKQYPASACKVVRYILEKYDPSYNQWHDWSDWNHVEVQRACSIRAVVAPI